MTNRKLKKLLRKKPYLLNDAFSIGEDEAAALAERHVCPSVEAILNRASARADWPPELTETIERLMREPPRRKRTRRLKLQLSSVGESFRAYAPRLIPAAAVLLIVGFFALTPFGRGLLGDLFRPGAAPESPSIEAPVDEKTPEPAATVVPATSPAPTDPVPSDRYLSLDAESIPDEALRAYLIDTAGAEQDEYGYYLTEAQTRSVCSLELPDSVRDLRGLEQFPALTSLSWHADGSVEAASLSGLTALISLDLALPSVQALDLSANTDLVAVVVEGGLETLDVSANEKLGSLTVSGGALCELELGTLPALHTLTLSDNALETLDVTGCPNLEQLSVDGNNLQSLDLSANTALRSVSVSGNHLRELTVGASEAAIDGGKQSVRASAPFKQDTQGWYFDLHLLVDDPSRVSFAGEGMRYDPATGILRTDTAFKTFVYRYHTGSSVFEVEVTLPEPNVSATAAPQTPSKTPPPVRSIRIEFETAFKPGDTFVRFDGSTPYMIYNGNAKQPPIRVLDQNGVILNPKLYDVTYSNNVNLGTAFVNVTMHNSDIFAVATFRIIAPQVSGLSASASSGGVRVSWTAISGAESYLVYRIEKPVTRGEWSDPALLGRTAEAGWSDGGVSSFMQYRYIVKACLGGNPDAAGESSYSNDVLYIQPPTLLSVSGEADEVTAVWSGIDGADAYEMQVSSDPGFAEDVHSGEFFYLAVQEGTIDRLTAGTRYYVRVRVIYNRFGNTVHSPWSNIRSCTIE
jgi:hypothetical protein